MKTGSFKDKLDERDFVFAPSKASNAQYPKEYRLENAIIKDQGEVNSCVAHSISTIKEIQEYYETGKKMTFSVGWIYGYRVGNQYRGEGMYPREALNNLVKYGDVLQADFPENLEYDTLKKLVEKRKTKCLADGQKYRCKAYAKVNNARDVKACLYITHSPVLVNCAIYDDFYKTNRNGIVSLSTIGAPTYHAMVIVGWKIIGNDEYWIVQNSWGKKWGDNGYCYIRQNSPIILDLYTVADIVNVRK